MKVIDIHRVYSIDNRLVGTYVDNGQFKDKDSGLLLTGWLEIASWQAPCDFTIE